MYLTPTRGVIGVVWIKMSLCFLSQTLSGVRSRPGTQGCLPSTLNLSTQLPAHPDLRKYLPHPGSPPSIPQEHDLPRADKNTSATKE